MADWICRTTGNYCAEIEHVERLEKRVAELEVRDQKNRDRLRAIWSLLDYMPEGKSPCHVDEAPGRIRKLIRRWSERGAELDVKNRRVAELEAERERWIETLKLCYRKHCMADDYSQDIGWGELADRLCAELANLIGDDAYYAWRDDMQHSEP